MRLINKQPAKATLQVKGVAKRKATAKSKSLIKPVQSLGEKKMRSSDIVIGIVQSRFNEEITTALREACITELIEGGVSHHNITLIQVPGALEIPITLQALAASAKYTCLVALGCVIRGETYHFELVSNESASGINRVSLDYGIPIINAVITTENTVQAIVRQDEKGRDAAKAALEMSLLLGSRL
jgi:6,7-dimethyl-8-ribityllumazine synthase